MQTTKGPTMFCTHRPRRQAHTVDNLEMILVSVSTIVLTARAFPHHLGGHGGGMSGIAIDEGHALCFVRLQLLLVTETPEAPGAT